MMFNTKRQHYQNSHHREASGSIDWILLVALFVSIIGNGYLGREYYRQWASAHAAERLRTGVVRGERLPPLRANRLGGGVEQIEFARGRLPTVLYVMKSGCVWCDRNVSNLRALKAVLPNYRLVLLALEQDEAILRESVARIGMDVPVYFNPSRESMDAYGLRVTPYTLVISQNGHAVKVWPGAYVSAVAEDVQRFFGLTLPGITAGNLRGEGDIQPVQ